MMGVFKFRVGAHIVAMSAALMLGACDLKQRWNDFETIQTGGISKPVPNEVAQTQSDLRTIATNEGMTPLSYANAGLDRVDRLCGEFFNALTRARRSTAFGRNQMSLIGGATAGVLAAAEAAAKSIAITAIGFALVDQTIANYQDIVLFVPVANELETVTTAALSSYRRSETFTASYDSLKTALPYHPSGGNGKTTSLDGMEAAQALVASYAYLCSPAKIEGYVADALKSVVPDAGGGTGDPRPNIAGEKLLALAIEKAGIPPYDMDTMADVLALLRGGWKDSAYYAEFKARYVDLDAIIMSGGAVNSNVAAALNLFELAATVDKNFAAKAASAMRRMAERKKAVDDANLIALNQPIPAPQVVPIRKVPGPPLTPMYVR